MDLGRSTEAKETASAKVLRCKLLAWKTARRLEPSEGRVYVKEGGEEAVRGQVVLGLTGHHMEFRIYSECDEKSCNKKALESLSKGVAVFLRTSF